LIPVVNYLLDFTTHTDPFLKYETNVSINCVVITVIAIGGLDLERMSKFIEAIFKIG
jgi:Trk-type K+ transport system membrane component